MEVEVRRAGGVRGPAVAIARGGELPAEEALGRPVAKRRGGDRHSGRIEAHGDFIKQLLAEQGGITLVEIEARSTKRGAPVGGTVHRFFARQGITRKKDRYAIEQDRPIS